MEVDAIPNGDGRVRIEAEGGGNLGNYNVSCAAAGLDRDPAFGPSPPSEDSSDNGTDILNPTDVTLDEVRSSNDIEIDFSSSSGNVIVEQARINFYRSQGNSPVSVDIYDNSGDFLVDLVIEGEFETLSSPVTIVETGSTIRLDFNKNNGNFNTNQNDWFIITLKFDNNQSKQYFVAAP
jgi:hypothetical protein